MGHQTTLSFDNFITEPFLIPIGLDQGCPLSPITFLFYNADLIGLAKGEKDMIGLGFINNTAFTARSDSFKEVNAKLKHLMEKENGALRWEERYEAEFEFEKMVLLCLTRMRKPDPNNKGKTKPIP
jgi:hypothetical protein